MSKNNRDYDKRLLANARSLDRRECFADSMDGMNAYVIFGMLVDEYEKTRSDLAHRPASWQPIETAPRDGTSVLVFCDNQFKIGHWSIIGKGWRYSFILQDRNALNPTHWMPLPAPPTTQKGGVDECDQLIKEATGE